MIKKYWIILACVFFLSPLTFALPQQQTVTGNSGSGKVCRFDAVLMVSCPNSSSSFLNKN